MKYNAFIPQDQTYFYLNNKQPQQLRTGIKADVVVIGGGIAGLSAAQSFRRKGLSVVLLEKNFCGSGASGKSSGFLTPDSELNLSYFDRMYGSDIAKKIWGFVIGGVELVENNIKSFNISCDYQSQDTLVVANSEHANSRILYEHQTRQKLSYESSWYTKEKISSIIGSEKYYGGVRYSGTFGVNAYQYCQAMKDVLESQGIQVFEETPVVKLHSQGVQTLHGSIDAENIVVCVDRFIPELGALDKDIFHAQTFLMISEPLPDDEIRKIFPDERLMVWDTDLIYQYFRVTGDNRLMLGGSDLISIFWGKEIHNSTTMFEKLLRYQKRNFPHVLMNFEYFWPGLIGVSKDLFPIADFDNKNKNVYYISGAAGLPWAAALGRYAADKIIHQQDDFDEFFSLKRKFLIRDGLQTLLGKRLSFAISNFIALHG